MFWDKLKYCIIQLNIINSSIMKTFYVRHRHTTYGTNFKPRKSSTIFDFSVILFFYLSTDQEDWYIGHSKMEPEMRFTYDNLFDSVYFHRVADSGIKTKSVRPLIRRIWSAGVVRHWLHATYDSCDQFVTVAYINCCDNERLWIYHRYINEFYFVCNLQ